MGLKLHPKGLNVKKPHVKPQHLVISMVFAVYHVLWAIGAWLVDKFSLSYKGQIRTYPALFSCRQRRHHALIHSYNTHTGSFSYTSGGGGAPHSSTFAERLGSSGSPASLPGLVVSAFLMMYC